MKIKQNSNTAWLVLFTCATLVLVHCSKGDDPGPEPISDEAAVMQAKSVLEIGYSGTDTAMSVTENVTLPTTGADGVVISWMSSDTSIISTDGTVTRPTDMDTDVLLTATLTKGDASDTTTFTLTAIITDAGADTAAVRNAKNTLAITYSGPDTAMSVTGNVTLPTTGADEVVISWMSSNTDIISDSGTVTRPTDTNTMVRLTATLSKNAAMSMRTFDLVVIITDAGAITQAINNLAIGYSGTDTAMSVTGNVTLPTTGADADEVVISWMSSDTSSISTDGTVTRPTDMDTMVRLTATLTKGAASDTTTFTLTVIITDAGAITQAINNLAIGYSGTDTDMSVTGNVTLPTTGANGVVISWMSSDTSIISTDGTVTRPTDMDTMVRLTATLTKGAANDTTTFTLTVIITDAGAITQAINNLAIGYSGTDTAMSVTGNVTLPTTGADEVVISWMSSDTSIVSTDGTVTRPDDMDTDVTLTATLSKGTAADQTKTFDLVVIITDEAAVMQAKDSLVVTYAGTDTAMSVTGNVTLPTTGAGGVVISWMSSDTGIISDSGTVTRPDDMDTDVTLTATLSKGTAADQTKTFDLVVIISVAGTNTNTINAVKTNLAIGYSGTDDATGVTANITLPTTGSDGVMISWASEPTGLVNTADATLGEVTRPSGMDTMVTLTATLTKGTGTEMASVTKEFMLTILTAPATNAIAIMRAKDRLGITYSSGDSDTGVRENLILLTAGSDGVMISWAAEPTGIVSTADATLGVVTRPGNMDTVVTLTATLTKGTGTEMASDTKEFMFTVLVDNPKLINIESVAQLIAMRHDPDGNGMVDETAQTAYGAAFPGLDTMVAWEGYELMADLDLDPELPGGSNWTPQSNIATNFEGNGYTISNMTISVSSQKRSFFSNIVSGGHVRNLNLRDVSVNGHQRNGGLAGLNSGTITNCSTTGGITTTGWFNGGLVGENEGTITASYSEVVATGTGSQTGGLVGYNRGTITASYATGDVTGGGSSTGGLVGDNRNTITASYATGDVAATATHPSARNMHGGLVGVNEGTGATIKASYATGNVNAGSQNEVGGLVGKNEGTITASYSTGTPTTTGSDIGGLVGDNDGTVTASYFDSTTSGITTGTGAQATSALQTPTEYGTDPAIYSGWNIDVDNGFTRGVDDGSAAGDTTADDPWDFGTASQYPALKVDFDGDGTAGVAEFGSQR